MEQTPHDTVDPVLTVGDVARRVAVDPKTVNRWATAGKLKGFRTMGGHWRFRASDIDAATADHSPAGVA
jgi:excisionase family DNA binding protein